MWMFNLRTAYGDCDLSFAPAGFERGYDDLVGAARERRVGDVMAKVAALDDIIRSQASATGPKTRRRYPNSKPCHGAYIVRWRRTLGPSTCDLLAAQCRSDRPEQQGPQRILK
ncbi:MAG: hypothetical protein M3O28_00980 [Actinomycetota bacterium]|nr:hypothetical protein [Actinomycetota bacterium]